MVRSQLSLKTFLCLPAIATAIWLSGCSTTQIADPNSAEGMYKTAEELEKDDRFEEAITKLNELRNKHPYSRYATEAELKVADIHFKKESFIESQTAYQLFKDFHPKYVRSDYVTFRLAMSYFNQLPGTIDRDLSSAFKSIQYFDEVLHSYSTSDYAREAKEKRTECYKMLAEKEMYIGNFYYIREMFDSAQKRFENLLAKYSGYGFDDEALYKAGVSAYESGDPENGKKYLEQLLKVHPNSNNAARGRQALEKYGRR